MQEHRNPGPHRVAITGIGCVSSFGVGARALWEGLMSGRSTIRSVKVGRDGLEATFPAAPVGGYNPLDHLTADELLMRDPFAQFAIVAAREAVADSGLTLKNGEGARTGVILGCGGGGEHAREEAAVRIFAHRKLRSNPMLVPKTNLQASVGFVSMEFGATGPSFVVSTGARRPRTRLRKPFCRYVTV